MSYHGGPNAASPPPSQSDGQLVAQHRPPHFQPDDQLMALNTLLHRAICCASNVSTAASEGSQASSSVQQSSAAAKDSNARRVERVTELSKALRELQAAGLALDPSITVPIEVMSAVDNGINPALIVYDAVEHLRVVGDQARGGAVGAALAAAAIAEQLKNEK